MSKFLTLSKTFQRISRQALYQDPGIIQYQLKKQARQLYRLTQRQQRRLNYLTLAKAIGLNPKGRLPLASLLGTGRHHAR